MTTIFTYARQSALLLSVSLSIAIFHGRIIEKLRSELQRNSVTRSFIAPIEIRIGSFFIDLLPVAKSTYNKRDRETPLTRCTNMDDHLHCAAKLNNTALLALVAGERQRALDLFRNAFKVLNCEEDKVNPVVLTDSDALPALLDNTFLPFVPVAVPCSFIPYENGSASFTYSKAFMFNPCLELNHEYVGSFQAVILFNLALIYQHASLCTSDEYEDMALTLYNEVIELLDGDNLDDLDYVYVATLNNKAQIHVARTDAGCWRK
jgi:hypothetical protein